MTRDLQSLGEWIDPGSRSSEVFLPAHIRQQLMQMIEAVRFPPDELIHGRSITAMFHGPAGAGKAMAALAIARELDRQVLRIDLSRVASKYIGETEKQINAVFEEATRSGAILLLDEADALFGTRSEVRDSNDRYASIEVSDLLPRIEAYEGIAILTTKARQNLDEAFVRRLRFVIEFPSRT
jgi:SpoVK/Ycf46/Vps4 family AAA+-type ATPase